MRYKKTLPPAECATSSGGEAMHRLSRTALATCLAVVLWAAAANTFARAADDAPPAAPGNPTEHVVEGIAKGRGGDTVADPCEGKGGVAEQTPETGGSLQARFNLSEGLVAETADGAFRYHLGGRFDWDSGWYRVPLNVQQNLNTPLLDGTDLRRFRLGVDGTVWQQVDFKLEADFSRASDFKKFQSTPQTNIFITDAWIALPDLPVLGTVKAGHQKE